MLTSVYNIITAALEADGTLSSSEKAKIMAVCNNPGKFIEPSDKPLPQLLTSYEVMEILKISKSSLRRMLDRGDLPIVHLLQRQIRFRLEDVEKLIERGRGNKQGNDS
jgi:excisionase family DNA binding protein